MPIYYITGFPGCGKSTFVSKIKRRCNIKTSVITKELLNKEKKRIGFTTVINDNGNIKKRKISIKSPTPKLNYNKQMKSYYVNLDNLKEISKEIKRLYNKSKILIIDEIASMQLLSKEYYEVINEIVNKENTELLIYK